MTNHWLQYIRTYCENIFKTVCLILEKSGKVLLVFLVKLKKHFRWHSEIRWPVLDRLWFLAKNCYFLRFHKWQKKHACEKNRGKYAFILLTMLSKHIYMGWKFQGILKSNIFHFKAFFDVLDLIHTNCLSTINNFRKTFPHRSSTRS